MAGSVCPDCKKRTLFQSPRGLRCSNPECNLEIVVPVNGGKGGKGQYCPVCRRYTVFSNKSVNPDCGAKFHHGKP